MSRTAVLGGLLAGLLPTAGAVARPGGQGEPAYETLLAQAKRDPEKADFKALRLAFAKTDRYRPYAREEFDPAPVEQELKNGERAAALEALDRVLVGRWTDFRAQSYAAGVCGKLGEGERAERHLAFMRGLIDAILGAGDGRSFETAWPVLDVREEYAILEAFELEGGRQALVEHDGHWFDVHTFRDEGTGRERKVYFNIDVPHDWLARSLDPGPGK